MRLLSEAIYVVWIIYQNIFLLNKFNNMFQFADDYFLYELAIGIIGNNAFWNARKKSLHVK